jgi:hypothetical protein
VCSLVQKCLWVFTTSGTEVLVLGQHNSYGLDKLRNTVRLLGGTFSSSLPPDLLLVSTAWINMTQHHHFWWSQKNAMSIHRWMCAHCCVFWSDDLLTWYFCLWLLLLFLCTDIHLGAAWRLTLNAEFWKQTQCIILILSLSLCVYWYNRFKQNWNCTLLQFTLTHLQQMGMEPCLLQRSKVKLSLYTPWWKLEGQETKCHTLNTELAQKSDFM